MQCLDDYLITAFQQFEKDLPTTDFQRGYLAALLEIAKVHEPDVHTRYQYLNELVAAFP